MLDNTKFKDIATKKWWRVPQSEKLWLTFAMRMRLVSVALPDRQFA